MAKQVQEVAPYVAEEARQGHTPGPWSILAPIRPYIAGGDPGDRAIMAGKKQIAEAFQRTADGSDEGFTLPYEANAKIIAAAPDLLAALESLVTSPLRYNNNQVEIGYTSHGAAMNVVREARAAIAKARGL